MAENDIEGIELRDASDKVVHTVKVTGDAAYLLRKAAEFGVQSFRGGDRFPVDARLQREASPPASDQSFWVAIRNRTQAIGFKPYCDFINNVLCLSGSSDYGSPSVGDRLQDLEIRKTIHGTDAYNLLKLATEAFLISECGVVPFEGGVISKDGVPTKELFDPAIEGRRLELPVGTPQDRQKVVDRIREQLMSYLGTRSTTIPYLDRIVNQITGSNLNESQQDGLVEGLPYCKQELILQYRATCPSMIELIWSYWHEEGMLVQTMNHILLRFQNKSRHKHDPLANLALDPLRPLNNIIWGFIQDEYNRLSVQRRCYEYDSQYGITLVGKAAPKLESADSRSQFIGAFHNLLYRTAMFYREDDDSTVFADAFPLLNALREVHLILAEGAHNQFGDLPWTARREMLIMQWMLARTEIKEFLRGRYMVPYQEPWMGAVDDMKRLQGWTDVTITHFRELGVYGEQILLSVRYGDWIDINDQDQAKNWARGWRPEIQRYMHAYHAVSGVDLTAETVDARSAEVRYAQPSMLLQKRLAMQQPRNSLSGGSTRRLTNAKSAGFASLAGEAPKRLRINRDND